jgi:hypothetical protein
MSNIKYECRMNISKLRIWTAQSIKADILANRRVREGNDMDGIKNISYHALVQIPPRLHATSALVSYSHMTKQSVSQLVARNENHHPAELQCCLSSTNNAQPAWQRAHSRADKS